MSAMSNLATEIELASATFSHERGLGPGEIWIGVKNENGRTGISIKPADIPGLIAYLTTITTDTTN